MVSTKKLLGIKTDEFDKPITEFEFKGGAYDMSNRIHVGEIAPTLTTGCDKSLHLVPKVAAGFKPSQGAKARAYSIENHPNDSRVKIDEAGKVQALTSRMGTGGGNVPLVMEKHPIICLQGNGIDRADTAGCNGKGWREDKCYTLNTIDRPAVCYGISSMGSNAMLSDNPHSGIYEAKTSRTLDLNGGNPACNQGGIIVCQRKTDVVYPEKTGPLMANSHPGSYCGQDAYQDMFVVERRG